MMDEEIREVREMKQMCGNINMKLTNIVTQRGQDWKKKLEAEYQRGFEDGKADNDKGCVGCKFEVNGNDHSPCDYCCNGYSNQYQAKQTDDEIKVGDEVKHSVKCFVVTVMNDVYVFGISKDGTWCHASIKNVRKTGRHFDIASILKEMRT